MAMLEPSQRSTWRNADPAMLIITLLLVGFGVVTIFSASDHSVSLTDPAAKQALFAIIGLIAMSIMAALDYRFWRMLIVPVYIGALGLLVLVLQFGAVWGGAQRWFDLKVLSFQPSE